mmetsp:Transcript_2413/g.6229  ORF Transcript_2413/g.6229 Transcript_2413/m.6229 type:complete len:132 (-) Transcript_2413:2061-2456(-)
MLLVRPARSLLISGSHTPTLQNRGPCLHLAFNTGLKMCRVAGCILAMTCSDTYPSAQSSACARCILANMPGHVPSNTGLRVYKVHPCFDMLRYLTSNADLMMNRILSQNHTLSADASSTTRNWLLALQTST